MALMSLLEFRNPNQQHTEAGNTTPARMYYLLWISASSSLIFLLVGKDQPMMPAFLTTASTDLMGEGSSHDACILNDSLNRPDGIHLPEGRFYLGDAGYACRSGILPLQENQISFERVLFKEQAIKCRGAEP
jgi:hypothetical protein